MITEPPTRESVVVADRGRAVVVPVHQYEETTRAMILYFRGNRVPWEAETKERLRKRRPDPLLWSRG